MGRIFAALAVVAAAAPAACSDPTLDVTLRFPPLDSTIDASTPLIADVARFDVRVVELTGAGCDEVALREVDDADLALGEKASASGVIDHQADGGGTLHAPIELVRVPRLGAKLFVFTGYDDRDLVVAGGCKEQDDIDQDTEVPIDVAPAIATRVLPTPEILPSLILPATDPILLIARERRKGGGAVGSALLVPRLRIAGADEVNYGAITATDQMGNFRLDLPTAENPIPGDPVGPVEIVIRGAWSDEVNRISAAVPPVVVDNAFIRGNDGDNQVDPSWLVLERERDPTVTNPVTRTTIVGHFVGTGGAERIVVATPMTTMVMGRNVTTIHLANASTTGAGALALFRRANQVLVVTHTAAGWSVLDPSAAAPAVIAGAADPAPAPADQLIGFPRCGGTSLGLITVTGTTVTAYAGLTTPDTNLDDDIVKVADQIRSLQTGATIELLGAGCLDITLGHIAGAMVRRTEAGRESIYLVSSQLPAPLLTPFVGAGTVTPMGANDAIVAAVQTAEGTRAQSFRLQLDPTSGPRLFSDGVVDHPLPAVPRSLVAMLANRDALLDTLAVEPLPGENGFSMTLGADTPGDELSAMTLTPFDAADGTPVVRRVNFLQDDVKSELLLADRNRLRIFDLAPRP